MNEIEAFKAARDALAAKRDELLEQARAIDLAIGPKRTPKPERQAGLTADVIGALSPEPMTATQVSARIPGRKGVAGILTQLALAGRIRKISVGDNGRVAYARLAQSSQ